MQNFSQDEIQAQERAKEYQAAALQRTDPFAACLGTIQGQMIRISMTVGNVIIQEFEEMPKSVETLQELGASVNVYQQLNRQLERYARLERQFSQGHSKEIPAAKEDVSSGLRVRGESEELAS